MNIREHLPALFADFGEPAEWAGRTAHVLFDVPDELVIDGVAIAPQPVVTLPAATWPGVKHGDQVRVAGRLFRVVDVRQVDDGALKRLRLAE